MKVHELHCKSKKMFGDIHQCIKNIILGAVTCLNLDII